MSAVNLKLFLRHIVHNRRWLQALILQHFQCRLEDGLLALGVSRPVKRVAVAKRDDQRSRRSYSFGHAAQQLNRHRRNALPFQFGCHQAHGLVANRSDRYQQRNIDPIFNQFAYLRGGGFFYQAPGCGDRSHKR